MVVGGGGHRYFLEQHKFQFRWFNLFTVCLNIKNLGVIYSTVVPVVGLINTGYSCFKRMSHMYNIVSLDCFNAKILYTVTI